MRRSIHIENGSSAVEFALILPLMMAVLGLAMSAGWLVVQRALLDRAAEVAVRELTLGSTQEGAAIAAMERTPLLGLTPESFQVTTTSVGGGTDSTPGDGQPIARGQMFTVTTYLDAPVLMGPLLSFFSAVPNSIGLAGRSQGARL